MFPVTRAHLLALAFMAATGADVAQAETWRFTPSIAWESTLTNNVNLSSDNRVSDWVNQITPSIRFTEIGGRTRLAGSISLPVLLYARTSENNDIAPSADVHGTLEAVENFMFVDASANVSQQFVSPLGARPASLSTATSNRYTSQTYTISPYIRGLLPNDLEYELRDSNSWTNANSSQLDGGRSYTNEVLGHLTRRPTPVGWALEYDRTSLDFSNDVKQVLEHGRGRLLYVPDPAWELSATAGYENNRLQSVLSENDFVPQSNTSGVTYGAGVRWRPNERTDLNASWEHRFFGTAYSLNFQHRMPRVVWSIQASRDITNYPQQLATLGATGNVSSLLDSLLSSRVPDILQRQTLVDQIIRERGLPAALTQPVTIFTQQITLLETQLASVALLGARNSVLFSLYRTRDEPLPSTDLGELANLIRTFVDTTQVGGNVVWTHQLASDLSLGANLDASRSTSNGDPRVTTRTYNARAILSRAFSTLTTIYLGARYQYSRSDIDVGYNEAAVFVGVTHAFH